MAGWASLRQSIGRVYGSGYAETPSKAGCGDGWSDTWNSRVRKAKGSYDLTIGTKGTSNDLGRGSLAGAQGQDTVKPTGSLEKQLRGQTGTSHGGPVTPPPSQLSF